MPEIGQIISHYRILKKIGQGGMGEVFLVEDTYLHRKVGIKVLSGECIYRYHRWQQPWLTQLIGSE